MAKNTSILLGDYFDAFVNKKIEAGSYNSVSEVIRSALRLLETQDNNVNALVTELKKGEKSGMVKNFNSEANLKKLHKKHLA